MARRLSLLAAALASAVTSASAQQAAAPPAPEIDCGAEAGLYAAQGGFKLWVVRRGTTVRSNPLRPLSDSPPVVVLEVDIAGRRATAYGPDYASLVRGGPPEQLEQGNDAPIKWEASGGKLPPALQIVAEDGSQVLANLAFKECGRPPAAKARRAPQAKASAPAPRAAREPAAPPSTGLPQGALNGLELQR
jgi:hypothetical protein